MLSPEVSCGSVVPAANQNTGKLKITGFMNDVHYFSWLYYTIIEAICKPQ